MIFLRLSALLLLFLGIQYCTSLLATLWLTTDQWMAGEAINYLILTQHPDVMGISLIAGNAVLIGFLWLLKWIPRHVSLPQTPSLRVVGIALITTLATVLAVNMLIEWSGLTDQNEQTFRMLTGSLPCMLAITLTGPLTEELVFRQAFISPLVQRGWRPMVAVLFSALIFGLAHLNPAQTVAATLIGLLFGFLYIRQGLWLAVLCHVFNNTLGFFTLSATQANDQPQLTQTLGTAGSIVFFIACGVIAYRGIVRLNRQET